MSEHIPDVIRIWMEEALDLLEQPGLVETNKLRRRDAIDQGYELLDEEDENR